MDQRLQLQQLLCLDSDPWRQREEELSDGEISESDVEEELDDVADSRSHNDAIMASSHLPTARGVALAENTMKEQTSEDDIGRRDQAIGRVQNDLTPAPWASSDVKQSIIGELKDETSDIHLFIGNYTAQNFDSVNFTRIREKHASNHYRASNFRENMKRLLRHLLKGTGPFKDEREIVEK